LPTPLAFKSYEIQDQALTSVQQIADVVAAEGNPERMWLVQYDSCSYLDVDFHCELLEQYVDGYYSVDMRHDFFRSRVVRLRRKDVRR
jgi:hypothetical protein